MEIRLSNLSVSLYKDHYGNKVIKPVLYHYIMTTMEITLSNLFVSLYKDHYGNKVIKPVCIII